MRYGAGRTPHASAARRIQAPGQGGWMPARRVPDVPPAAPASATSRARALRRPSRRPGFPAPRRGVVPGHNAR